MGRFEHACGSDSWGRRASFSDTKPRTMKVRASVKPMCEKCKIIRRRGARPRDLLEPAPQAEAGLGQWHESPASTSRSTSGSRSASPTSTASAARPSRRSSPRPAIDPDTQVKDLTEDEVIKLREAVEARDGRGRPAPRALPERQAPDGDRLLPRPAPPARPAGRAASARRPTRAAARVPRRMSVAGKQQGADREVRTTDGSEEADRRAAAAPRPQEHPLRTGPHQDFASTTRSSRSPTPRAT